MTDERSGTAMGQLESFSFSSSEPSRTGGRCPPDPLGFFALWLETAGACRAGITPARPAVYKPPIGAQVASPQSPILRWSASRISALDSGTRGAKQKSAFDRTSGFANYKLSALANYSRPVLLAPRQTQMLGSPASPTCRKQTPTASYFFNGPGKVTRSERVLPFSVMRGRVYTMPSRPTAMALT